MTINPRCCTLNIRNCYIQRLLLRRCNCCDCCWLWYRCTLWIQCCPHTYATMLGATQMQSLWPKIDVTVLKLSRPEACYDTDVIVAVTWMWRLVWHGCIGCCNMDWKVEDNRCGSHRDRRLALHRWEYWDLIALTSCELSSSDLLSSQRLYQCNSNNFVRGIKF